MTLQHKLGREIGHGGFGIVYEDLTDPGTCIKVSSKNSNCRKWSNEYKKIVDMISRIHKTSGFGAAALGGLKYARIVRPSKFIDNSGAGSNANSGGGSCYMYMPRIYRPDGEEGAATIQAQLGIASANLTHKGRGHFVGLKEISKYSGYEGDALRKWLKRVSYELGKLMAMIHYVGKNDGVDIEVYMGKLHRGRAAKFFIADFDMSEEIKEYDDEIIRRLVWSLEAVPYFPVREVDVGLYDAFSEGYLRIAAKVGRRDIAEQVLDDYSP